MGIIQGGIVIEGARQRPYENAGAPVNGTTLANVAEKGALLSDTTNGVLYINTGTKASPTWTIVGSQT